MVEENTSRPLAATEFTPLTSTGRRYKLRFSPGYLVLGVALLLAVVVFIYLFVARAVIFRLEPETASVSVSGLAFHIGNNFLLLPGEHSVTAHAQGYYDLNDTIEVSRERNQEIDVALEPLPGKLQITSELENIEVYIDDEPVGVAPGSD